MPFFFFNSFIERLRFELLIYIYCYYRAKTNSSIISKIKILLTSVIFKDF